MTASACWTERSVQSDSLCVSKTCMWQACMWQTCKPTQQKPFFSFADASGWGWRKKGNYKIVYSAQLQGSFLWRKSWKEGWEWDGRVFKKIIGASRSVHCCLCPGARHVSVSTSCQHHWHTAGGRQMCFECLCTLYTWVVDRYYAWFQLNTQQVCSSFSISVLFHIYPFVSLFFYVMTLKWTLQIRVAKSSGTAPSATFYSQRIWGFVSKCRSIILHKKQWQVFPH